MVASGWMSRACDGSAEPLGPWGSSEPRRQSTVPSCAEPVRAGRWTAPPSKMRKAERAGVQPEAQNRLPTYTCSMTGWRDAGGGPGDGNGVMSPSNPPRVNCQRQKKKRKTGGQAGRQTAGLSEGGWAGGIRWEAQAIFACTWKHTGNIGGCSMECRI